MLTMAIAEHNDLVIMSYNTLRATELRMQTKTSISIWYESECSCVRAEWTWNGSVTPTMLLVLLL